MFDLETQLASHRLSLTLNVLNADEDIVSKQDHDDKLNSNDLVESSPLSQDSMPSLIVLVSSMRSAQTSLVSYVSPLGVDPPQSLMYVFGQQGEEQAIFLTQASQFLFSMRTRVTKHTFVVLSLFENDRFRKRYANFRDQRFMTIALRLLFVSNFVARDNGKRLRLITSTTILEETRSKRLKTMIVVSQHSVQNLIHRFENYEDLKKEL